MNNESELITRLSAASNFFEAAEILGLDVLEDLGGSDLQRTDFANGNLAGANLRHADLSHANLSNTNLSNADLSDANLDGVNLSGADLTGAKMSDASLRNANLCGCDLSQAQLSNANLSGVKLTRAFLGGAFLNGANLTNATLKYARLMDADLSRVNFSNADLSNANLSNARLNGAIFSNANLSGANLIDASMVNVSFKNAKIEKTQFGKAQDLTEETLSDLERRGAVLDESIKSEKSIQSLWRGNPEKTQVIFGYLNAEDVKWIRSIGVKLKVPAGKLLIEEGKTLEELHIVLQGRLEVCLKSRGNKKIAEIGLGAVVGEMSLVANSSPSATVRALEDSSILSISRLELRKRLNEDEGFSSRFYRAIAIFLTRRLSGANRSGLGIWGTPEKVSSQTSINREQQASENLDLLLAGLAS